MTRIFTPQKAASPSIVVRSSALALLALAATSATLLADTSKRHAESHEHGVATLEMALDGNRLIAAFTSPAMNIVGFEHIAEDESDIRSVKTAIEDLKEGEKLILMEQGGCTLTNVTIEAEGLLQDTHETHEEDAHDGHSEFEAAYEFTCTTPDALKTVAVGFFKAWPGIEEIETVFLSEKHQISAELTADTPQFEIE